MSRRIALLALMTISITQFGFRIACFGFFNPQSAIRNPESASAIDYRRANVLFTAGRVDEADTLLKALLAADPDYVPALTLAGKIAMARNRPEIAGERFERAARLSPRTAYVRFMLGFFLYVQNDFERALTELLAALELDPKSVRTCLFLALAYEASTDAENAGRFYERALDICKTSGKPLDPDVSLAYARFRIALGRFKDAAPLVESLLRQDSTSRDGHYEMGRIRLQSGQVEQAIEEGEKALEAAASLNTTSRQIHALLARAYARAGRTRESAEHMAIVHRLPAPAQRTTR